MFCAKLDEKNYEDLCCECISKEISEKFLTCSIKSNWVNRHKSVGVMSINEKINVIAEA